MQATHRVQDSNNKTIGFIVDNTFLTDYFVAQNISLLDNLTITKNGIIRSKRELPVIQYKDIMKSKYEAIVKQNPFVREIQNDLLHWKNDVTHQVIQIDGARQIGKTTEILKFAYSNYAYVIYVNLADDKFGFVGTVIEQGTHILVMEAYCRKANLPHFVNSKNTVIIIDEIQISSKVYNSIRTINGTFKCDLIVTGSYLGRILGDKRFFLAAGTVETIHMFQLSFKEFCKIFKADTLLSTVSLFGKSSRDIYDKLESLYSIYRQIGGHPTVIRVY